MTISDLKVSLLKLVVETEDREVLEEMAAYFHALLNKGDWWEEISEKEKEAIRTGLRQLDNGEGIPYESFRNRARQVLGN
ncbi:MAG: hypothetical protein ACKVUS_16595 [Saprospiraceae bacterium]